MYRAKLALVVSIAALTGLPLGAGGQRLPDLDRTSGSGA